MNPQFNRESLVRSLKDAGISYVFLGKELGARPDDRSCYVDGRVSYERLAHTELFGKGIERVTEGAAKFRVALMCAEKDPIECHRAILVGRELIERRFPLLHIHSDGRLESQAELMARLRQVLGIGEPDMVSTADDLDADAYRRQRERIAYEENTQTEARAPASAAG
jgi:hypothetical protein